MTDAAITQAPIVRATAARRARAGVSVAVAVGAFGTAAASGGYFPTAWGWIATISAWAAALVLLLRRTAVAGRWDALFVSALAAVAAWIALSLLWTDSPGATALEAERALAYVTATAALVLLAQVAGWSTLIGSLLAGLVAAAAYGLATRLLPDRLGRFDPVAGYRLAEPVGYWNALGIVCAAGSLVALAFAARARTLTARSAAAAAVVVLLPTLYFTFSRGAWLALGIGLVVAVSADPRRVQLMFVGLASVVPAAGVVLLASRSSALTHTNAVPRTAAHDGHRVAVAVVVAAVGAGLIAVVAARVERRVQVPQLVARSFAAVCAVAVVAGATFALAHVGGPVAAVHKARAAFTKPPPRYVNLNERLFTFSSHGRSTLWSIAWHDAKEHPLLGSGAGTYEREWLSGRTLRGKVRDAHSLYLEALAELGPFGLALFAFALLIPFATLRRGRRHGPYAGVLGAYVAFVVHAGIDWDWEVPEVTILGLACGAGMIAAARRDGGREISRRGRATFAGIAVAAGAVAFVGLAGNLVLAASSSAARQGDWSKAASRAHSAATWIPWSPEPWQKLGNAQLAQGQTALARASFRKALSKDSGDWSIWFDLARASSGRAQLDALAHARRLNPLSPEIAELRKELRSSPTLEVTAP